jgi:hypothetical protein
MLKQTERVKRLKAMLAQISSEGGIEIEELLGGLATLDWLKRHDAHQSEEATRLAAQMH